MKIEWIRGLVGTKYFEAVFQCEKCGNLEIAGGEIDKKFFEKVLPNAVCPACGRNSFGETLEEEKTRLGEAYELLWDNED